MAKYTYTNELGEKQVIKNQKEAEKVIIATATFREYSRNDILEDSKIVEIANIFDIDLINDLVVLKSDNPDDFFYVYYFD